jgi:hypothetical protein
MSSIREQRKEWKMLSSHSNKSNTNIPLRRNIRYECSLRSNAIIVGRYVGTAQTTNAFPRRWKTTEGSLTFSLSLSLILRPTATRPVCLGIKHTSGAYDQISIIVWQLRSCFLWAPSLDRGRVLSFVYAAGPFRRLLRLAGSRWRYSNPSPHEPLLYLVYWVHCVTADETEPYWVRNPPI